MKLETINVGRIVNAHGIRGEVRVQPRDGDPAFLTQFKTFLLNGQPVTPTANHVHKSVVLMKLPGDADSGALLGELVSVDAYPAHKVYTVRGTEEYLIPAVPEVFIQSVDLDANQMEVRILEGMRSDEH